jgi:hypothetical protein
LCGLTETDWTPDFTTIQDFAQLMGEDGMKLINEGVVEQAVKLGLADAKVVVADLTAQEAAIPHPNEMGLLGGFVRSLEATAGKAGQMFKTFLAKAGNKFKAAKEQVRKYRLFAKDKTKAAKDKMVAQMAIPELYSVVRGKVGKSVEFGLSWGITRLRGGFVLATMAGAKKDLTDATFAVQAVEQVAALFGKAPRSYAYDRAGHSARNVERLRELGVRNVELAPRGKTPWQVEGAVKARLIKERALVEGSIGTIKSSKYGFNRPAARSVAMMGVCGQRAVLGLNLTKLARGAAQNRGVALVT